MALVLSCRPIARLPTSSLANAFSVSTVSISTQMESAGPCRRSATADKSTLPTVLASPATSISMSPMASAPEFQPSAQAMTLLQASALAVKLATQTSAANASTQTVCSLRGMFVFSA
jgi:hypothetical protein